MAKIDALFMIKTLPFGAAHTYIAHVRDRIWKALLEQSNLDFFKVCRYHFSRFITQGNLLISFETWQFSGNKI